MNAWHFLQADKRLRYDGRRVRVGQTLKAKGEIVLCENGMHASTRLIDALKYAPGPIICRVDVRGEIVRGDNKIAGRERTVEWMIGGEGLLHRFACRVAENALRRAGVTDERCWNAINTKLKWLRGEATDQELTAARSAAWAAARAAASDAAWAAARAAARAAAWDAARDAAWDAARAAAWDAARAAAWDAARDEHNRILTAMVVAERRKTAAAEGAKR